MKKLLLLLGLAAIIAACKPCDDPTNPECENYCDDPANPDCFNYDPCLGKVPVSAEFKIEEIIEGRKSTRIETDTILYSVFLTGPENATRYEWHIGTDARTFTSKEVFLRFAWQDTNTSVPIVLIVEGAPNSDCFPDDDGRDTFRRSIFVAPARMARIVGRYRGVRKLFPTDTITIEISRTIDFRGLTTFNLWNLPETCQDTFLVNAVTVVPSFYGVLVEASFEYQCHKISGMGRIKDSDRDSLIFPFTNSQTPPDVFRGKRIKN